MIDTQKLMKVTGGYQAFDFSEKTLHPREDSLVYKKFKDLNYESKDFAGMTVADLGSCLGFFSFLSVNLGAISCIGYDNEDIFLEIADELKKNYEEVYPEFKNKVVFQKIDLYSFPNIEKTDIVLAHSILHWFFNLNPQITMRQIIEWLYSICKVAVYFEGCLEVIDPSMKRYAVPSDRCNMNLFLSESERLFRKVEILGSVTYSPTRLKIRMFR